MSQNEKGCRIKCDGLFVLFGLNLTKVTLLKYFRKIFTWKWWAGNVHVHGKIWKIVPDFDLE